MTKRVQVDDRQVTIRPITASDRDRRVMAVLTLEGDVFTGLEIEVFTAGTLSLSNSLQIEALLEVVAFLAHRVGIEPCEGC